MDVEMFATVLEEREFIVVDRATEEVLVRSFVKHDGLMDQWNMAAAVARTFSAVASKPLRGAIVHELKLLSTEYPEWRGWGRSDVKKVLRRVAIAPADARRMTLPNPSESPNESPSVWGNESPNERGIA